MRIITGPDGNLQFLPDEIPMESIQAESAPMEIPQTIPNPDNIPGISDPIPTPAESVPEVPNEFRVLNSYGSISSEELFQIHFNREMERASAMSDDDLMLCIKELNLIVEIGKIRVRAADKIRIDRLDGKQRTAKEKQKLADTAYKPKRKEQILAEKESKESAEPKKKRGDVEILMSAMGMSREEAEAQLAKMKAKGK